MGLQQSYFYLLIFFMVFLITKGQNNELNAIQTFSETLNSFALKLLADTSEIAGDSLNVALSPYTVWTLLLILSEGAKEQTLKQLETVLKISQNKNEYRKNYKSLSKYLVQNTDQVQLDISNAIFTTSDQVLNRTFEQLSKNTYNVDIKPTNFNDKKKAANEINSFISKVTKNRIPQFVSTDDLNDAEIFLTSALYLKGQWKMPFNKTATYKEDFLDENGNKNGDVMMMYQIGSYAYTPLDYLKSFAVELDYGKDNKMSMIVILPAKGEKLSTIMKLLTTTSFTMILKKLDEAQKEFIDEDVEVYLPKFSLQSDFNLNIVLEKMGIKDIFNAELANLLGIFPHYLHVSRIIQKAEIEVNEEGTIASAAAGGALSYKIPPPKFHANRPFIYIIINKETKSIVFIGKVSNPNDLH